MGFVVTEGALVETSRNDLITDGRPFGITTYRGLTQAYEVIYATQPALRTVVDFLGRNIASIAPPKLYERVSDTERRHLRDHPLARLLRRPHPRKSAHAFYRDLVDDLGTFDNATIVKAKVAGAPRPGPFALVRIPPQRVDPEGGDFTTPATFRIAPGTKTVDADQMLHIHGYNPRDNRWGLSPIETLRGVLDEDIAAQEARGGFWRRAARLSGWIERPAEAPEWSPTARDRFTKSWVERWGGYGTEAGGTPVLEEGMKFHNEEFDSAALQYLEARKLTREETFEAYHVAPGLMRGQEGTDGAARRGLYSDTFGPILDQLAGELLVQLLPDFEAEEAFDRLYIEFDLQAKLAGHFLDQAEVLSRAIGGPWMQRSEGRALANLPPLEEAEGLIVPLNVTIGGRASPADTAPGTPGAGQVSRPAPRARRKGGRTTATKDWVDLAAKAVEDLPARLQPWATRTAELIADVVDRQRASFLSRLGAGHEIAGAFQADRWDRELAADLAGIGLDLTAEEAGILLDQYDAGDDPDVWALEVAEPWVINNAGIAAGQYNASTLEGLRAADEDEDLGLAEAALGVFVIAAGSRAVSFGLSRTTTVTSFARNDAADALGLATKTWRTNSANPRPTHAALNGTTIGRNANFAVGSGSAPWPGHPSLPPDESANCTCDVDFG